MRMGFEHPIDCESVLLDMSDDHVGRGEGGATRGRLVVQHTVHDGGSASPGVMHDVGNSERSPIEKRFDRRHV